MMKDTTGAFQKRVVSNCIYLEEMYIILITKRQSTISIKIVLFLLPSASNLAVTHET